MAAAEGQPAEVQLGHADHVRRHEAAVPKRAEGHAAVGTDVDLRDAEKKMLECLARDRKAGRHRKSRTGEQGEQSRASRESRASRAALA